MKKYTRSLFNGNHFSSIITITNLVPYTKRTAEK